MVEDEDKVPFSAPRSTCRVALASPMIAWPWGSHLRGESSNALDILLSKNSPSVSVARHLSNLRRKEPAFQRNRSDSYTSSSFLQPANISLSQCHIRISTDLIVSLRLNTSPAQVEQYSNAAHNA